MLHFLVRFNQFGVTFALCLGYMRFLQVVAQVVCGIQVLLVAPHHGAEVDATRAPKVGFTLVGFEPSCAEFWDKWKIEIARVANSPLEAIINYLHLLPSEVRECNN